ncbi:MAG: amidohydrolase [Candidatus Bathyarchaeia archaeon]
MTVDPDDRVANAVAIVDGRFRVIGSDDEALALLGNDTRVVDLGGRMAMPGIIDSHTHPSSLAMRMLEVDCRSPGVKKIADILQLISDRVEELEPGEWVRGANFNDSKLEEGRHITRWELDEVAPENPVFITSDTGHQSLVNSRALELAGIDEETLDPAGGKIDRNDDGAATGLLYEKASGLVRKVIPDYSVDELKESLKTVFEQFSEWGMTSTHDASGYCTAVRAYKKLLDEGFRRVRISLMMSVEPQHPEDSDLLRAMSWGLRVDLVTTG